VWIRARSTHAVIVPSIDVTMHQRTSDKHAAATVTEVVEVAGQTWKWYRVFQPTVTDSPLETR
jgi:hypothetical protein